MKLSWMDKLKNGRVVRIMKKEEFGNPYLGEHRRIWEHGMDRSSDETQ